jgi:lipopolysaccharide heptosyltransferase II
VKILLIRLRLIGDVVFTTPAIRAVRRTFPEAHITYLVERAAFPIVANNPHLDQVLAVPHARGWRRIASDLALARRLRRRAFDVVVDFHGGPRASWLGWATGAPKRIGYEMTGRSWLYTDAVPRPRELRSRHSVENQWDLLAALSPALSRRPDPADDRVEMLESPDAAARVAERLARAGVEASHEVIVVHVSAGNPFRRWPAEFFVELVSRLGAADPVRRIILTSGPSEAGAAAAIGERARRAMPGRVGTILTGEEFSLAELRSVLARAALFIGGDSGPLHVASTSDVPIVGLYGPTLPVRSAPWRPPTLVTESVDVLGLPCRPCDQRHCLPGDYRCLTQLPPARVIEAAERALARAHASRRGAARSKEPLRAGGSRADTNLG